MTMKSVIQRHLEQGQGDIPTSYTDEEGLSIYQQKVKPRCRDEKECFPKL